MAEFVGGRYKLDTSGFAGLGKESQRRQVTLKGVKAGIKVLQHAAKAAAPRRKKSGALKQSQGTLAKKGRKGTTVSFAVQGAKKGFMKMVTPKGYKTPQKVVPAFYDHLVQGGTQAHRLGKGELIGRAARGKMRSVKATAQTTGGRHPGTAPNPYRKRAYEAVKAKIGFEALVAMGEEYQKILQKNAAKVK